MEEQFNDLAQLYQVETRTLKQAVRRNIERFPDDFLVKLPEFEFKSLINSGVSQIVIPQVTTLVDTRFSRSQSKV